MSIQWQKAETLKEGIFRQRATGDDGDCIAHIMWSRAIEIITCFVPGDAYSYRGEDLEHGRRWVEKQLTGGTQP